MPGARPGTGRPPIDLGRILLWVFSILVFAFLVLPLFAIVPLSFNGGSFLTYPLDGASLRWYEEVFTTERWRTALRNSLIVSIPATLLSTVLGTLAALGLSLFRFRARSLVTGLLLAPLVVPVIITAVGMTFAFAPLGLTNSFGGLILANTVLGAPLVVVTVLATLAGFDRTLIRAALSLGAPPILAFFRVVLPLIAPGVFSGAVFAFASAFDEHVVILFLGGPGQRTLPREIFDGLREHVTPAITAVATLFVLLATLLMVAIEMLRRRTARLGAPAPGSAAVEGDAILDAETEAHGLPRG
jgi:putative spermidine/putrescine transport system permease protein